MDYKEKVIALLDSKELSQEQKEKLEEMFPELKESEYSKDEKIRNFISNELACLRATDEKDSERYEELTNAITWLEKQGEQDNNEDLNILQRFSFYSYKDEPNILYLSGLYVNEEYRNKGIGTKILEVADEVAKSLNCHAIRLKTKKGSSAERLYRTHGYNSLVTEERDEIWLEKQGEQKPVKNIVQIWKDMRFEIHMQASGDDMTRMFSLNDIDEIVEKISEQKLADKIEPKFHEGEWIIRSAEGFKHNTYLVKEVKDYYACEDLKDRRVTFTLNDVHKNFKLWDISDAKDGDVLRIRNLTFIFQEITNNNVRHKNAVVAYCSYEDNDDSFGVCGPDCITDLELITPATKKQRDTLFKAMTDAGYRWNPDKKKPEQIENKKPMLSDFFKAEYDRGKADAQKSTEWSEDDEKTLNSILNDLGQNVIPDREDIDWLKSIKDRVQPKQEWSEEEQQIIEDAASVILGYINTAETKKEEERLEELADKLQDLRPQKLKK